MSSGGHLTLLVANLCVSRECRECLAMDVIMERDQRTVRALRDRASDSAHPLDKRGARCACTHTPTATPSTRTTHYTLRLRDVLTISACLLTVSPWPTSMAAPTFRHRGIPKDKAPLWVNPCGYDSGSIEQSQISEHDIPIMLSDSDMLKTIILSAQNALGSVESFKHGYVKNTFDVDFDSHHNTWKEQRYDWLFRREQVPKSLGITTHTEHLNTIELDEFLKDAYRLMQTMAVALEQVAWDQELHNTGYGEQFKDVEYRLRSVLCEIQMAMIERKVDPHPDVTRDVMTDDFRFVPDNTNRHLRDWIIFRDYMVVLEYIKDVLQFFYDNPSRISPS